jgi:YihY family inner membrane protein
MVLVARLGRFALRVLRRFRRNNGLLLASALAYNGLLSIVPLFGLVLIVLSHLFDRRELVRLLASELGNLLPGVAQPVTTAISAFLEERAVAGGIGLVVVIVFSALAFRTLDDAMSVLFEAHEEQPSRHPLLSALLPLVYIGLVLLGVLVLTLLTIAMEMLPERGLDLFGWHLSIASASRGVLRALTFAGFVALLSSFYRVLPEAKVRLRHAMVGGLVAAVLWEFLRSLLLWYFANVSLVGVIYGSLTTVIVLLLSLEAGALVLLLGGQVIAEIDRSSRAGVPWYEDPAPRSSRATSPPE